MAANPLMALLASLPKPGAVDAYKKQAQQITAANADRSGAGTPVNKVPNFIEQMQKVRDRNVPGNGQGGGTPKQNPMMGILQMLISQLTQGGGGQAGAGGGQNPMMGGGMVPTHAGGQLPQGGSFKPFTPRTVQGSGPIADPNAYYDPNQQIPNMNMQGAPPMPVPKWDSRYTGGSGNPTPWSGSNA